MCVTLPGKKQIVLFEKITYSECNIRDIIVREEILKKTRKISRHEF